MTKLCICNNCLSVMVDENPSDRAEFETKNLELVDMEFLTEDSLEPGEDEDQGAGFWGCPKCLTDGYLMDVEFIEQIKHAVKS